MEQHAKSASTPTPPHVGTGIGDVERPLRRRADLMLAGQKEAFELALALAPLSASLEVLARTLEVQCGDELRAAVLLRSAEGLHWQAVARGSCPAHVVARYDGRALDASPAPLGEALERLQPAHWVDAAPREGDPDIADALQQARVRNVTAWPILSTSRELLGVWLLLRRQPGAMAEAECASLQEAAQAAALLVEHDHRQRQRAEDDRRQAKALSTLVHDLRNPLSPLRNTIELLTRVGAEPALVERATTIMSRQLGQLAHLMEALSDLSHSMPQGVRPPEELPRAGAAGMAGEDAQPAARAAAPEGERAACKVLVADDNEMVRDAFVELLRAEGYDVRTAVDGVQAVEVADQWRPQVVLLDIHMPRLSGLETARRLRAAFPPQQMTLLMMSGMTLNDAWMRHAKAAGFDDCLDKTADPKLWLARLREAIPTH